MMGAKNHLPREMTLSHLQSSRLKGTRRRGIQQAADSGQQAASRIKNLGKNRDCHSFLATGSLSLYV